MRIEPHFWPAVECSGFEQKLFDTQLAIILGCHEQLTVCQFGVKQVHGHCSCNLEQLVQGTHTFCCNTACMRTLGSIFSSVSRMQVLYATFADNQLAGSIPVMSNITLGLNMSSNRFSTVSFEAFANSLQLLYLANNSLNGTLAFTLPANLSLLDVSYNDFSGPLPSHLPPGMSVLNVSHNAFNRSLPKGWGKIQSLAQLNLDNNKFSGALPAEWSALGNNTYNSLQMSILMQTYKAICHDSGFNNFAWPSSDSLNRKCCLSLSSLHLAYQKFCLFKWDLFFSCPPSMQVSMCLLGVRYTISTTAVQRLFAAFPMLVDMLNWYGGLHRTVAGSWYVCLFVKKRKGKPYNWRDGQARFFQEAVRS